MAKILFWNWDTFKKNVCFLWKLRLYSNLRFYSNLRLFILQNRISRTSNTGIISLDLHIGAIRIWTKPSRKKPKIVFRCQNRRYSQFLHFSHKIYINTFPRKKIRSDSSKWQGRSNLSKLGLRTKFQKDKDLDPARGSCYGSWISGIWLIFTNNWVLVGGSESSWGYGRCSRWFLRLV